MNRTLVFRLLPLFLFLICHPLIAISLDGLVAFYPFSGNAQDASGNGHHGVNSGAQLNNDRFYAAASAYRFRGGYLDHITVPDHPQLRVSSAITIAIWVHHLPTALPFEDLVMKGNNSYGFQFNDTSSELLFHLTSGGWRNLNSGYTPQFNTWFHIAGTYDGEWQKVYINGVLTNSAYFTGGIYANSEPLYFGKQVAGDNNWYTGILDDFYLFNRALSADEIMDLYRIGIVPGEAAAQPQDLQIEMNDSAVNLSWTPPAGNVSHKVYSSDNPYTGFSQDQSGAFQGNSWSATVSSERQFYKVSAVTESGMYQPDLVLVQGGTFNNGVADVTLSDFYIDRREVTAYQYYEITGETPQTLFGGGPNHPVYNVSWLKAIAYCNLRSLHEGLNPVYTFTGWGTNPNSWPSGWHLTNSNHNSISCDWLANGYRLLTEMEWMYAAMGGALSQGYTYSGSNTVSEVAWCHPHAGGYCHEVSSKTANELGLYDMSGNVEEWVWDKYGDYSTEPQTNPTGVLSSLQRVTRGGSHVSGATYVTVVNRMYDYPANPRYSGGFRLARSAW